MGVGKGGNGLMFDRGRGRRTAASRVLPGPAARLPATFLAPPERVRPAGAGGYVRKVFAHKGDILGGVNTFKQHERFFVVGLSRLITSLGFCNPAEAGDAVGLAAHGAHAANSGSAAS